MIEGSPLQPVRGPGGPRDRGSPRSSSGSRPGPGCGARCRHQPERLEEAQRPDRGGAPADHGPRGGGRRRRAWRGRCGRGRRRSRVRLLRRGGRPRRSWRCCPTMRRSRRRLTSPAPPRCRPLFETATRALDQLGVASGSTLLINGASGSVGSAAVVPARRGARCARDRYRQSGEPTPTFARWGPSPSAYGDGFAGRVRDSLLDGAGAALDVAGSRRSRPSSSSSRAARSTS